MLVATAEPVSRSASLVYLLRRCSMKARMSLGGGASSSRICFSLLGGDADDGDDGVGDVGVDFGRFAYQHEMQSGWLSDPTCFGGSVPFRILYRPPVWSFRRFLWCWSALRLAMRWSTAIFSR